MKVYLDNAATTPIDKEVLKEMMPLLENNFGNPSSIHSFGRISRSIVEAARKNVSKHLRCSPGEIFFTSGGTEADNMAIRCGMIDLGINHAITSRIEHNAVLHPLEEMSSKGLIKLSYVNLDEKGNVDLFHLEKLLKSNNRSFISLMHANNEIGNLLDIMTVGEMCKTYNAIFHSDTVQTMSHYTFNLSELPIHFITGAAHKFHGPKGVGFSFVRKNSGLNPFILGGSQERGLRAGTESVHNIVGMSKALELAYKNLEDESKYIRKLKKYAILKINELIPESHFNGNCDKDDKSAYNLINVNLPISSEKKDLLDFQLDLKGIACSKGSACQSGSDQGSHVLEIVVPENLKNRPSLRFSFSSFNSKDEIDFLIKTIREFI